MALDGVRAFQGDILAKCRKDGTTVQSIEYELLKSFPIPVPPHAERLRILAKLDDLLGRVAAAQERLDRVPRILRRFRRAVLATAFTGDLGIEDNHEPDDLTTGQIPSHWRWSTIGDEFEVKIGATPRRNQPSYWNGDIPWVSSGEVQFNRIQSTRETISEEGLERSSTQLNPTGTVLLAMIGEGRTRGQAAILDVAACNNQNCAAIWVSETPTPPEWVYFWLEYRYEETRGRGIGGEQPALNKQRVRDIPIPMTAQAEQTAIVERVRSTLETVSAVERRASSSNRNVIQLTEAILASAFSGAL